MSVLSFPPDSPRLWDITCYIFHQMENIFSVIILDFLCDNITGTNRSGQSDVKYIQYFLKVHTHVISFWWWLQSLSLNLCRNNLDDIRQGRGGTIRNHDPPGCGLRRLASVRKWIHERTARMHFLFRHNNKPFPNNNISIFTVAQCKKYVPGRTIEISFSCFFCFESKSFITGMDSIISSSSN